MEVLCLVGLQEALQILWFRTRCYLEYPVIGEATVGGDNVQIGIEILEFPFRAVGLQAGGRKSGRR